MVVRIRLSRFGCKNRPFYRVMAADSRSPRDGKHLEVLGYYNPLPANDTYVLLVVYLLLRSFYFNWCCRYWLSVGAQPSEPVQRILFRSGLLPPPPMLAMAHKGGPRDTRAVDPLSGRFVALKEPTVSDQPEGEEDEEKTETSS
ncbi:Ribosomal protein S16 [Cinnamomum micranthum f. kanehirae]|uniref:Ribosomal protein S16 n=1 Tax=Cinnamomum micranthum f. kanehirae TaxID=337451 RepID=A0A3S3M8R2_9MAGN|nr:Ribosomal protein S16 [Cinnamomum micranthum f. kanehirae]